MSKINLPVLILKGIVLLPNNEFSIELNDDKIQSVIYESEYFHDGNILIVNNINLLEESTNIEDLPKIGVIAKISKKTTLPNKNIRILLKSIKRVKVVEYIQDDDSENLESFVEDIKLDKIDSIVEETHVRKLKSEISLYIKNIPYATNSIINLLTKTNELNKLTDLIVPIIRLSIDDMYTYLLETDPLKRSVTLLKDIKKETKIFEIDSQLEMKIKQDIDKKQREYILREKINTIKEELGETSLKEEEIKNLKEKTKELKCNEKIKNKLDTELKRYEMLNEASPESNIIRNYIAWLIDLPWNTYTRDNDDLLDVRNKLNSTHNGLEKVKTRIIEYLAVKQMTNSLKGPIICLVGPPGTGKTSLAISIANAMNRNFVKMSLGGISDEAELIGHRRTYIGASPGRIISSLKKAKSSNPIFLIDEIDKMLKNYKGDPASVLLEILDPEQNKLFYDNYIEEEYDLSEIMFIATANYLEDIPEALRDRLEIVKLSGYTEYEKLDIAKKYLLPKICKDHGVNFTGLNIRDNLIIKIIRDYTRESGVRELDRLLSTIVRKVVTSLAMEKLVNKFTLDNKLLIEYLGNPKYESNKKLKSEVGVVNGLAYTPYGGDVLPIEVTSFEGTGKLILTGSLGDVMKESASIAFDYLKSNYKKYNIDYDLFNKKDYHIHAPEGAVKKEGPSAGIALTTAILSVLTNSKIDKKIAMTGEVTLRGNVLPIGGLKEKVIGAFKNKVDTIIIPRQNVNDLDDIPKEIKDKIKFVLVDNYKEVYKQIKNN